MLPQRSRVTAVFAFVVVFAVSCTSTSPTSQTSAPATPPSVEVPSTPSEEATVMTEPEADVEAVLLDDKTAVFHAGTDIYQNGSLVTTATPQPEIVEVALATLATAPDLSWVDGHARLISGYESEGSTQIRIDLSCDAAPFSTPTEALQALQDARNIDGGGACYGFALFDSDGKLIRWRTNGES